MSCAMVLVIKKEEKDTHGKYWQKSNKVIKLSFNATNRVTLLPII